MSSVNKQIMYLDAIKLFPIDLTASDFENSKQRYCNICTINYFVTIFVPAG